MIDAYRIGVSIAMTNGVSSVLGTIAKDMMGLQGHVKNTESSFTRLKGVMVGAAGIMAGGALLGGLKHVAEAAMKFRVEQERLTGAGFTPEQRAAATKQAFEVTTRTPGANIEGDMTHVRELKEMLGSVEAALQASETLERVAIALGSQTGVDVESSMKFLAKSIEIQAQEKLFNKEGKFDKGIFDERIDAGFKAIVAANGLVTPQQMYGMLQQGGVAAQMQNFKTFWADMGMAMVEQGGLRSGTGLAASFRGILNGVQGKDRQAAWVSAGLSHYEGSGKSKHAVVNKDGEKILTSENGGYMAYMQQQLIPKLLKQGHFKNLESEGAGEYLRTWVQKNGSTETMRRSMSIAINQTGVQKAQNNYNTTPGFEATYANQQANNPELAMKAFHESWHTLMVALGLPEVSQATSMMSALTVKINALALWASQHQELVHNVEVLAATVGVLVVMGGTMLIVNTALTPFTAGLGKLIKTLSASELETATAASARLGGVGAGSLLLLGGSIIAFGTVVGQVIAILQSASPSTALSMVGSDISKMMSNTKDSILQTLGLETTDQSAARHIANQNAQTAIDNKTIRNISPLNTDGKNTASNVYDFKQPQIFPSKGADLTRLGDYLSARVPVPGANGKPIPVQIVNPGAITSAVTRDLSNGLGGPSRGGSGADNRVSPPVPGGHPQ